MCTAYLGYSTCWPCLWVFYSSCEGEFNYYVNIKIVFCLNYFTANDQEKQVKCNLIFPQGAKVEKRTASKSFLKARPKAEPSECLRAGLFSTEAPWGMIKLHETGFSVSFQLKNNSNRMFFRIYWTFLKILM